MAEGVSVAAGRSAPACISAAVGSCLLLAMGLICGRPAARVETLACYSTDLAGRTPNQRFNALRAARSIDGAVVQPGAIFSFNAAVGSWSADRGYRRAPVSYDGTLVDEYGGGVCQASTTLYNAALLAGLPVLERHAHTFSPGYAPPGRDAAVAYANVNLLFRNPFRRPLTVRMGHAGNRLICRILSDRAGWGRVLVHAQILDVFTPPPAPVRPGSSARRSRWRLEGRDGLRIAIYRECFDRIAGGGYRLAQQELISDNTYTAISRAEWRRPGPGADKSEFLN